MSSLSVQLVLDIILGLCGFALVIHFAFTRSKRLPLPPGPKPLPLIGNLLDLPKPQELEAVHWAKHKALYGPISSVNVLGTTLIIVNDKSIAFELLEKRSAIYSSRPTLTFAGELVGLEYITTLQLYGDTLRMHRKWMQNFMGTRAAVKRFESLEEVETRRLLLRILNAPDALLDHLRALPGAIILKMAYGYTVNPEGSDYMVDLADESVKKIFSEASEPSRWLVDIIPALKYVPEWVPGAGFKKMARQWRKVIFDTYNKPFRFVKHQMASGNALPSFTSEILENENMDENESDILKYTAATLYGGGADTSVSALATFYLAMTLFPDVLRRAQEEVDRVVGNGRLPSFSDREHLPYVDAVVKETLRWENVVLAGVPHLTTEEDTYRGYAIPKGSIVIANIWQMSHDSEDYSEPFAFKPERFLGDNPELDSRLLAFGFGRRICPGKELAENSLFIAIAMTVAAFDISKTRDSTGREVDPVHEYGYGIISHPKPFQCSVTPRSEKAAELIRSVVEEHPFEKGDEELLPVKNL